MASSLRLSLYITASSTARGFPAIGDRAQELTVLLAPLGRVLALLLRGVAAIVRVGRQALLDPSLARLTLRFGDACLQVGQVAWSRWLGTDRGIGLGLGIAHDT